jgi:hypothetical protein
MLFAFNLSVLKLHAFNAKFALVNESLMLEVVCCVYYSLIAHLYALRLMTQLMFSHIQCLIVIF